MHRFAQWQPTLIVVRGDEPTRERRRRLRHERCRVDRSRGRRVVQRALAYGLHRHRPETGDESRTEGVGRAGTQNSKFENLSSFFPVWPRDLWPRVDLCCASALDFFSTYSQVQVFAPWGLQVVLSKCISPEGCLRTSSASPFQQRGLM